MATEISEDRQFIDNILIQNDGKLLTVTIESIEGIQKKITAINNRLSIAPHFIDNNKVIYPLDRYAVVHFH